MKRKKFFAATVAGVLAAAQMAVPVMAADGGDFTVTVETKTPVIRVVVPTSMQVAVDQFGMADVGSQVYSNLFAMENKSEIPVKVSVKSTATLGSNTKLVATKAAADSSTEEGEVWLAVAAQTSDGSYVDGSATTLADLTEGNKNVATFVKGSSTTDNTGTVNQTFYLNKSNAMKYKLLNANESAAGIQYAQFYKLTEKTMAGTDDSTKLLALKALVKEQDVYYVVTANKNDGVDVTRIPKGTAESSITYAAANTYYTAASTATEKGSITDTHAELYVYGDGATDTAGKAAFRYMGKLSGQQETWTNDDIATVKVEYTITGVEHEYWTA